ncbi:metallophosphoesterase [Paenibacillus macquariensis]|uniref:Predicted phosphohydrolase, MPP superfamily n=1 Tax=Paenibacillus macquariensis TaxID=948756 RepID=A0ABY1JJT9_9BACL|nr:metallophosphoesterase family protein [Paenibacillus macquariensis]MEC0089795.1 metallophosphoesterase family protein [Paenibacillus macquariensis]OAB30736.1 hypothetical protein PMSM_21575 [Paenibacillus macquariensis subsp. macquariensis]SIQ31336.1 Predicted phosphohydrolase, MPP superfamily [Paenibacillus macquariensis]
MSALIWVYASIALVGLSLICKMINEALRNKVSPIEIEMDRLPTSFDGSRILLITDIHRRKLPESLLMALHGQVDWVFLAGDIMEKNVPLGRVEANMKLLRRVAPVYAVHGNHDYKAKISSLDNMLEQCDIELLMNSNVRLDKNGDHVWLTGMDYPPFRKRSYPALPKLPVHEMETCRIVLVHDPAWANRYSVKPADLTLAGHTHGGQINLPFIGLISLDKEYHHIACGLFQWNQPNAVVKTATMLVSRGFGYRHLPLRLRCPAEMHLITLRANKVEG